MIALHKYSTETVCGTVADGYELTIEFFGWVLQFAVARRSA
jgi:hypothetical protein